MFRRILMSVILVGAVVGGSTVQGLAQQQATDAKQDAKKAKEEAKAAAKETGAAAKDAGKATAKTVGGPANNAKRPNASNANEQGS